MVRNNESRDYSVAVFSYKGNWIVFVWIFALIAVISYVGYVWVKRDFFGGSIFFMVSVFFVVAIGLILLLGRSDVVVDDVGVSRSVCGILWQKIKWSEIDCMVSFPVYMNPDGLRAFRVTPVSGSGFLFLGRIVFTSDIVGISDLIGILNDRAIKYGIEVKIKNGPSDNFIVSKRF